MHIHLKGCGLRDAEDRQYRQYIGAAAQSVIHLIDRRDDMGGEIAGRLNTPVLITLFEEGPSITLSQHLGRVFYKTADQTATFPPEYSKPGAI